MTDNQEKTPPQAREPISLWLYAIEKLASVVAEEQRPQLIILILTLIFFQVSVFTSSQLSEGVRVLMGFSGTIIFLSLAFFVLPKQVHLLRVKAKELEETQTENSELKRKISVSDKSLSESIGKAYKYLEDIAKQIIDVQNSSCEEETKKSLREISLSIDVKKREFDSAVDRVQGGGEMIDRKDAAGTHMAASLHNKKVNQSEETQQVSR